MPRADVVVVGGGIGGLTCAAFLARQGVDVTVLERSERPGGLARGIAVDGRVMPLGPGRMEGLAEGDANRRILDSLEATARLAARPLAQAFEVRVDDGFRCVVPAGVEAAREALRAAFPDEADRAARALEALLRLARETEAASDDERHPLVKFLGFPFLYPALFRARRRPLGPFLGSRSLSPRLRTVLAGLAPLVGSDPEALGAVPYALHLAATLRRPVAVPGGGRTVAGALAGAARAAGVDVRTRCAARAVICRGSAATGVRTDDQEFAAKVVISDVSPLVTFGSLVPREAIHAGFLQQVGQLRPSASVCVLLLAVRAPRAELSATGDLVTVQAGDDGAAAVAALDEDSPAGRTLTVSLSEPPDDAGAAGAGETWIAASVPERTARWSAADAEGRERLAQETEAVLRARLGFLHPELESRVAASRLVTPLEVASWSGDPEGCRFGYELIPSQAGSARLGARTPVDNLLLAGAWTYPGAGWSGTMLSGFLAGLQAAVALGQRVKL